MQFVRTLLLVMLGAGTWSCTLTASRTDDSREPREAPAATQTDATNYSLYELPSPWRTAGGDSIALQSLAGTVRVLAMVYTSCNVTCPMIIADLKRIEAAVPAGSRAAVGFVLVSLDPERDTPERLASWARQTGLDPARWTLLTGSDDAIRELAASLDVRYQGQADGEVAHTNGLTVLDRDGVMRHRQLGLGDTDATIRAVQSLLR